MLVRSIKPEVGHYRRLSQRANSIALQTVRLNGQPKTGISRGTISQVGQDCQNCVGAHLANDCRILSVECAYPIHNKRISPPCLHRNAPYRFW